MTPPDRDERLAAAAQAYRNQQFPNSPNITAVGAAAIHSFKAGAAYARAERDAEVEALVAALRDVLDQSSPTAMFNSHLHKIARTALADWESAELAELGRDNG